MVTATTAVTGSVALWGRVIEHERGYRAEFAYPDRVRLVCAGCLYLFADGVPGCVVQLGNGALAPVCAEHLPILLRGSRDLPAVGVPLEVSLIEGQLLATYAVDLLPLAPLA